eukprot:1705525-Ditylum_brightwellii.AAC.1
MACGRNDHERVGNLSIGIEQVPQGFPAQNGNKKQPPDADKIMNILEYGVPVVWCREFTLQGFDPVDQGLEILLSSIPVWSCVNPAQTNPRTKSPLSLKMQGNKRLTCLLNLLVKKSSTVTYMGATRLMTPRTATSLSGA